MLILQISLVKTCPTPFFFWLCCSRKGWCIIFWLFMHDYGRVAASYCLLCHLGSQKWLSFILCLWIKNEGNVLEEFSYLIRTGIESKMLSKTGWNGPNFMTWALLGISPKSCTPKGIEASCTSAGLRIGKGKGAELGTGPQTFLKLLL